MIFIFRAIDFTERVIVRMELKLTEVAERIRTLREIMGFTTQEMADTIGCTVAEYGAAENGETDFSFTFLFKCADKFGVDMIEILTGENPHLLFYSIVRKGEGLPIKRRSGFDYYHLAPYLKGKFCEPFLVTAPYKEEEQEKPIELSTHEGQEFDFILKGSLKAQFENHTEILHEGDSVIYDSSHGHGMIATGGEDCLFLAIILKVQDEKK